MLGECCLAVVCDFLLSNHSSNDASPADEFAVAYRRLAFLIFGWSVNVERRRDSEQSCSWKNLSNLLPCFRLGMCHEGCRNVNDAAVVDTAEQTYKAGAIVARVDSQHSPVRRRAVCLKFLPFSRFEPALV